MSAGDDSEPQHAREELYVAARVLEETQKSKDTDGDTDTASSIGATVYARAAENVKKGATLDETVELLDGIRSEYGDGDNKDARETQKAIKVLKTCVKEIREKGRADIVGEVDDAVVAQIRSGFDREE